MTFENFLFLLGQRIKKFREARNLSQLDLADAIGCDEKTICKIENGKYPTTFEKLNRIAEYLKVTIDMFILISEKEMVQVSY